MQTWPMQAATERMFEWVKRAHSLAQDITLDGESVAVADYGADDIGFERDNSLPESARFALPVQCQRNFKTAAQAARRERRCPVIDKQTALSIRKR